MPVISGGVVLFKSHDGGALLILPVYVELPTRITKCVDGRATSFQQGLNMNWSGVYGNPTETRATVHERCNSPSKVNPENAVCPTNA